MAGTACRGGSSSRSQPRDHAAVPLTHDAYVWQRAWTGAVRTSVAHAPSELAGLRVLTFEIARDGTATSPAVSIEALLRANRPITAVVRIDGSRVSAETSLAPALERIERWRRAGVPVAGLEIDHDCATAALGVYAIWLEANRPSAPRGAGEGAAASFARAVRSDALRFSITALPTWANAPPDVLHVLAAAVDEIVLQVHAVQAPAIFDPTTARRWVERFAAAVPAGTSLRVALPTYKVALGAANPDEVATLLRSLEHDPVAGVTGVVWFRLPVAADRAAWPAPVLAAVIRGAPPSTSSGSAPSRSAPLHVPLEETSHVR
jgi:hypothetical protein